ncbi:hypothetical protein TH63_13480 [Rufibacter radiotolerans]|uniref:Protein phosphatase 2C n=1 Tax=Rufibacter radiotolerans TaxID=1379910 RepID=A0A0H4VRK0_9BACT|nr:hypothetical protein [Rufibacter radiotolerans]AKQ46404.1 hypothetical protein TH63_13480 [Rufibacter radiotolerans]
MQISINGYITHKKGELYSDCRDSYAWDKSCHKFAISDGVSKSFFPGIWSQTLVNNFVNVKEVIETDYILKCQEEWLNQVKEIVLKPDARWYTKNAFNRNSPGLATFVGLQFFEKEKKWTAYALGDSFLFFLPKGWNDFEKDCVKLSSKSTPIEFDNYPDYLSSIGDKHKGKRQRLKGKLESGTFYLMTDALAEWFLNSKEIALHNINIWRNQADFERFVDITREGGKLSNDDSAILIINVIDDGERDIVYTPTNVSVLAELIAKQGKDMEQALIASIEITNNEDQQSLVQEESADENERSSTEESILNEDSAEEGQILISNDPQSINANLSAAEKEPEKKGLFPRVKKGVKEIFGLSNEGTMTEMQPVKSITEKF